LRRFPFTSPAIGELRVTSHLYRSVTGTAPLTVHDHFAELYRLVTRVRDEVET
jgi:hypothetical protein